MPAKVLDGLKVAAELRQEIEREVAAFHEQTGVRPCLTAVLVGDDEASRVYVRNKRKACRAAGIDDNLLQLPASTTQAELLDVVDRLNADAAVSGILVQLPLPRAIGEQAVLDRIDPIKDVDGFHPDNMGRLACGRPRLVPCTPLGIQQMLIRSNIETRGKRVVIIGRSNIVGKPMALLLVQKGSGGDATVTIAHTATPDLPSVASQADILIVAAGRPEMIDSRYVKPGAVVVDVGIHRRADGTLCGDVAPSVAETASWLSPVPGGVGPMTVTMLLHNTLRAARMQHDAGHQV